MEDVARRDELAGNLKVVRDRIAAACAVAGRSPGEVSLVAITKTFPASDVALLAALGLTDVGENRDQEAAPKAAECSALGLALRWHFVGQLQVNKAASVVRYAGIVHSVDRMRLVRALGTHALAGGRQLTCLIQVNLDDGDGGSGNAAGARDGARGGARPGEVPALADAIAGAGGLVLGGVMAVAPLGAPARPAFGKLREISDRMRAAHPAATMISAGMSGDMEEAIAEGATYVRVGTALLGGRPPFVR
ncbi:MAG TPA: YggS family pyridoxal phosphate-dependent enzyme [Streptosporangiaceae bacterium]|nr:YggS family pyridoxal phosphate-dependent enzyme [Streptosporangiaceae bacterium]